MGGDEEGEREKVGDSALLNFCVFLPFFPLSTPFDSTPPPPPPPPPTASLLLNDLLVCANSVSDFEKNLCNFRACF